MDKGYVGWEVNKWWGETSFGISVSQRSIHCSVYKPRQVKGA